MTEEDLKKYDELLELYRESIFTIEWLLLNFVDGYEEGDCFTLPNGDCISINCELHGVKSG